MLCTGLDLLDRLEVLEKMLPGIIGLCSLLCTVLCTMLCTGLDLLDRLELLEKMRPSIIDWLYANLINTDIPYDPPGTNVKSLLQQGPFKLFLNYV